MLALAVIGLLAVTSHADTASRVPGTTLRFGLTDSVLATRGFAAAESGTSQGRCRFFGLQSRAKLSFENGRLARAEFKVDSASTYEIAYVEDQLTAMGYRKSCRQPTPKTRVCDWTARTQVHLEVSEVSLKASIVPAGVAAVAPAPPRVAVADTASRTAERAIGRLKGTPAPAETAARVAPAPPRDTARSAPVRAPSPTGPPRDSVRSLPSAPAAVPVLPETLEVQLAGRPSRHAPATVLSQPHCVYPVAAGVAGIQGRVWVLAFVDTDGRVIRTQVSRGIPTLDAAALRCVKDWSFKPVTWKGAPCRFWALVPVTLTAD